MTPTGDRRATFENVVALVLSDGTHTEEDLDAALAQFRLVYPELDDEAVEKTKRSITERLLIDMDMGVAVTDVTYQPWLEARYTTVEWRHWLAYKQWLVKQRWSPNVIDRMDAVTDRILDFAGDPSDVGTWARRGLVIGDVQSGKTASYLAVFNKAVDAGYRLIIVLAGGTEVLRQQTQERVDEGLIGRDSRVKRSPKGDTAPSNRLIGVGTIDATIANAMGLTTVAQDFRKTSFEASNIQISADSHAAYVFVLKKNKTVLGRLAQWLDGQPKSQGKIALPVLLLDDEADYASVNTQDETSPTAINAAIRGLLKRFARSSYVAFTATPFANIFIDSDQKDDLFPRDYVYALDPPTNYVGANATFGSIDVVNSRTTVELDDAADWLPVGHRSTVPVEGLSESLEEAIRTFFVANALRDLRGDAGPRSMLVNVSRYKAVQRQVHANVEEAARVLRNALDLHAIHYAKGSPNPVIASLERAYSVHYGETEFSWPDVLGALRNATARIEVQLHNSDRDKALTEKDQIWDLPPRVIAVGGDVLSRGLTLNGLTVSYFHRRVGAYDTLMQMARWFGYRDGYGDLCRVWIDDGVAAQYRFVQDAIDELRLDLSVMHQQKLTPQHFGLSVKKHPGALLVTARNKMKTAADCVKEISLAGRRIESTRLSTAEDVIDGNLRAFAELTSGLCSAPRTPHRRYTNLWQRVPKATVASFLDQFVAADSEALFVRGNLSRFVRGATAQRLQDWDVVIVDGAKSKATVSVPGVAGTVYYPPERSLAVNGEEFRVSGRSSRLGGTDDVASLLREDDRAAVRKAFVDREGDSAASSGPAETEYYGRLERPVLFIYPLQAAAGGDGDNDTKGRAAAVLKGRPLVAAKVAVPSAGVTDRSADVTYVINKVAQQHLFPEFVEAEDEDLDQ
jgi:hypothetical protein